MHLLYLVVLTACSLAMLILVANRVAGLLRSPGPGWARFLNESAWTLIPVAVMVALWWRAA